jgi:integrase
MPTIRLNDRTIAALKPTRRKQTDYFDHALSGFGVRVGASGRKTFILCYRLPGTRTQRRQSLGVYPRLSLADAREAAQAALRKSTIGRDPAAEQQAAKTYTFGRLAERYIEKHAKPHKRSWRADARMIRRELEEWRDRPLVSLRRRDVRDLLDGIVGRGAPILANRVHSLISKVLSFAITEDDDNGLEVNVAKMVPKPSSEQSRSRVLTEAELRTTWAYLDQRAPKALDDVDRRNWTLTRASLKLRLLTAQRGKEVLAMRWADLDGAWWTIPAAIAKNKLPHRVYLSKPVLALIAAQRTATDETYVFAGIRGTRQRRGALDKLPVADVRPHDFRRTAATMMASGGVPRIVISKILNHVDASVTAVYDRASYDAEKQGALIWWATKLDAVVKGKRSTVLPFARTA